MATCSTATAGAALIAQRCDQARQTPDGWQACCPAHEDRTPSLSITPTADRILLYQISRVVLPLERPTFSGG